MILLRFHRKQLQWQNKFNPFCNVWENQYARSILQDLQNIFPSRLLPSFPSLPSGKGTKGAKVDLFSLEPTLF
jgi:hypothetical protein